MWKCFHLIFIAKTFLTYFICIVKVFLIWFSFSEKNVQTEHFFLFWLGFFSIEIFSVSIVRTSFILFPLRFFISIVKTFNILSSTLRQVSKSRYHWEALEIYNTTNPLVFKLFNSKYIRFRTFYLSFILLSPKYFITFKGNTFKVIYPSCFYMNI